MRHLAFAAFVAAAAGSQALACDDHHGKCEVEAWRYHNLMGVLTIEGSASCDSGLVSIRLFDGDEYLGNANGFVQGHALTAHAADIQQPANLVAKFSIDPGF